MNSGASAAGAVVTTRKSLHRWLRQFGVARRLVSALRRNPLGRAGSCGAAKAALAHTPITPPSAELLAAVAHELRTPLATLHLAAAQLDADSTESVRQLQALLGRQLQRMSRLVDDLLDIEAGRTGRLRVEFGPARVRDVVHEALEGCHPFLARRRQRMVLLALPPEDCVMEGDAPRLTQVLVNLLENASKYSPEGGEVGLMVTAVGPALVATVWDKGIGITPELLELVFEPFVREPRAVRFHAAGLGLGLTLVRDLVAAHGGQVRAQSDGVGRGSRFVVKLPLRQN